jgi:fatty acid desaturase
MRVRMRMKTLTHTIVYSIHTPHTLQLCEVASFFVGICILLCIVLIYFTILYLIFYCILFCFYCFISFYIV